MISLPGIEVADTVALLSFLAAVLLVDSYDISLPRGDSIGVAGALVAASLVLFGAPTAAVVGMTSTLVVQLFRTITGHRRQTFVEVGVRATAIVAAGAVHYFVGPSRLTTVQSLLIPATFLVAELFARQFALSIRGDRALRGLVLGNLSRQGSLFAAELSVSALTVLTYDSMGVWSMIPVVALLLLMRQAYSMLLEIRETYLTTISVLVEAAESQSPELSGHSERTAAIAREIGARCGMGGHEIERLSYAALLHDVAEISEGEPRLSGGPSAAEVIQGIVFLSDVVPVLEVVEGKSPNTLSEASMLAGFIVALSSEIDRVREDLQHASPVFAEAARAIPSRIKADVVSAAVGLGYRLPAID